MPLVRPFRGIRPAPQRAAEVVAPPYDVLNTEEARQRAAGRPWSFLHISKPEIDLPVGTDPFAPEVYSKAKQNYQKQLEAGLLQQDAEERYYVYQLTMGQHTQTGLVVAASVADYDTNRIRKHEFTRPDKEDDRVRQIDALQCQTGPVFLTYRNSTAIDAVINAVTTSVAEVDVTADDGVRHCLWSVTDSEAINTITATFDAMPAIYIADGHHRSASASRICAQRKQNNPNHTGNESYNYFLSVVFPDNQMMILDYNRVVTDLHGLDSDTFLQRVADSFTVTEATAPVKPQAAATFGMYLGKKWYSLTIKPELIPANDPVGQLDVSLLAKYLIEPILGINDPRRDKRIDFVGGIRGLEGLEKRVNSGEMAVAFSLYPTSLAQLMQVADANEVMPPKSTWFEPKLADGLVSHSIE